MVSSAREDVKGELQVGDLRIVGQENGFFRVYFGELELSCQDIRLSWSVQSGWRLETGGRPLTQASFEQQKRDQATKLT